MGAELNYRRVLRYFVCGGDFLVASGDLDKPLAVSRYFPTLDSPEGMFFLDGLEKFRCGSGFGAIQPSSRGILYMEKTHVLILT